MKILKYVLLVGFLGVILSSCLSEDRNDYLVYGNLPTVEVTVIGEPKPLGQETEIEVTYKTSNSCQTFVDFQSMKEDGEEKTLKIAVVASQRSGDDCLQKEEFKKQTLKFKPSTSGVYTLKFWSGANDQTPTYITRTITIPTAEGAE